MFSVWWRIRISGVLIRKNNGSSSFIILIQVSLTMNTDMGIESSGIVKMTIFIEQ